MQLQENRQIVQGMSGAADTTKDNETADVVDVVDDASNDGEVIAMKGFPKLRKKRLNGSLWMSISTGL